MIIIFSSIVGLLTFMAIVVLFGMRDARLENHRRQKEWEEDETRRQAEQAEYEALVARRHQARAEREAKRSRPRLAK